MRTPLYLALLAMTAACTGRGEAGCFAPGTVLPTQDGIQADRALGGSTRDLALALLNRDLPAARTMLDRDPALARARIDREADMLTVALASCDHDAVDLLLAKGAPANGIAPGVPLIIALRADEPWHAQRLLSAGASPHPAGNPLGPVTTAIALGSAGGVRLLLDHGADPNLAERTGNTALLIALDMDQFTIAELLLARGADAWAIDSGGGNLGSAVTRTPITGDPAQLAAQQRLAKRLPTIGWPSPPPDPRAVRALALDGAWPPAGVRGARPVPEGVLAIMRRNRARSATQTPPQTKR